MQTNFNVVLTSIHTINVKLPQIGDVTIPAGKEIQLLNAPVDVINSLRNTFASSGVSVLIGKKSSHPVLTHDFTSITPGKEVSTPVTETKYETPLEKVANFELPSGKHKGKKIKELDDNTLRLISRTTKTQVVKSAIDAYLNLK